ncbi:aspartic peptidase domain-containing protein [Mycena galopus ATCC 62051]|nr:aspartic peptidase domain-containing protein [Mycena galopus ATCC 62051]
MGTLKYPTSNAGSARGALAALCFGRTSHIGKEHAPHCNNLILSRTTTGSSIPGWGMLGPTVNLMSGKTSTTSDKMLSGHLERRASSQELNFTIVTWAVTFDSSQSSTATNISLGSTMLGSGFGPVTGDLFEDTISLGSYSPQAQFLNADGGPFGIPSEITGFLGLAPTGFWGVNLANGQVAAPEMGLWLSSSGSEDPGAGGSLTFGGVNPSLYSGDIEFLPLTGAGAWTLNISALSVGGRSIPLPGNTSLTGFSTGLYQIAGPAAVWKTLWAAVPGSILDATSGVYHFPCSPPPNITVSFGGRAWPLNVSEITVPMASGSANCQGAIITSSGWNFGHGFLKYVYTVYRAVPPSIGFAELSTFADGTGMSNSTGNSGSPTSTGGSTTISGGQTQSGAVSAQPEPKPHIGAIVGAVIGGLAVLILVAVFVFFRARRRSGQRTAITPFVVDEQDNGTQTNEILGLSLPSSTSVVRSLSTMKRERSAARSRYRGIHTAPDGTGQTSQGLQGAHPMSSELSSTDRGPGITTRDPVAGIGNPAVLEEMHNLLAEMRRVATEQGRPYAPPSYS